MKKYHSPPLLALLLLVAVNNYGYCLTNAGTDHTPNLVALVSDSGNICNRLSLLRTFKMNVDFLSPLEETLTLDDYVDGYNLELEGLKMALKRLENDNLFYRITNVYQAAKQYEQEFKEKYETFLIRFNGSADRSQTSSIYLAQAINNLDEGIESLTNILKNLDNEKLSRSLGYVIKLMRDHKASLEKEKKYSTLIGNELIEISTFLDYMSNDTFYILNEAQTSLITLNELKVNLTRARINIEEYVSDANASLITLIGKSNLSHKNTEHMQTEAETLENRKDDLARQEEKIKWDIRGLQEQIDIKDNAFKQMKDILCSSNLYNSSCDDILIETNPMFHLYDMKLEVETLNNNMQELNNILDAVKKEQGKITERLNSLETIEPYEDDRSLRMSLQMNEISEFLASVRPLLDELNIISNISETSNGIELITVIFRNIFQNLQQMVKDTEFGLEEERTGKREKIRTYINEYLASMHKQITNSFEHMNDPTDCSAKSEQGNAALNEGPSIVPFPGISSFKLHYEKFN